MREYKRYRAFISSAHVYAQNHLTAPTGRCLPPIAIEGCDRALPVRHFRHQCFDFRSRLWPCCFLHFRNFLPHRFPLQYYTTILTPINPLPPPRFRYLAPPTFLNSRKLIISLTHPQNPLPHPHYPHPKIPSTTSPSPSPPPSPSTGAKYTTGIVSSCTTSQH